MVEENTQESKIVEANSQETKIVKEDEYIHHHRPSKRRRITYTDKSEENTISVKETVYLPHDLIIFNILASRLPLLDLIRARAVCKTWRDALVSKKTLVTQVIRSNVECHKPQLLIEHSSASGPCLAVYDADKDQWSLIPTPYSFQHLVAASKGVFCFTAKQPGRAPVLVIGNPITQQWKTLPTIPLHVPSHGPQIIAMSADASTGSYKIMILFGIWDDDASDAYLPFVYDSTSGKWTCRSTISAMLLFATARSIVKPPCTLLSLDSNGRYLFTYDMEEHNCSTRQLRHVQSDIDDDDLKMNLWRRLPQITHCDDKVFLVARCLGGNYPGCRVGQVPIVLHKTVGIWQMHQTSDNWEFVTKIPHDLLESMVKGSDGTDFIIASNSCDKIFFILKGSPHMLAFEIESSSWTVLQGCPPDYNTCPLHQSVFYDSLLWVAPL